jgi:ComF family protein
MSLAYVADQMARLLFPPRCQVCGKLQDSPICETCWSEIEFISAPMCRCCGMPLDPLASGPPLCSDCRSGRKFSGARSVGLHAGPLRQAIIRYKYHGRRRLAEVFGEMLADLARADGHDALPLDSAAAVLPVPLHPARRRWRGFDQAELLCAPVAEALGIPVWTDALERVRDTTPQVDMRGKHRHENVRNAFEARKTYRLTGRSFILIDDVFTTGATISECARMLRKAGAADVYALTVARADPRPRHGPGHSSDTWGDGV